MEARCQCCLRVTAITWTVTLVKQIEFEQFWLYSNNFEQVWKKTVFKMRVQHSGTMSSEDSENEDIHSFKEFSKI